MDGERAEEINYLPLLKLPPKRKCCLCLTLRPCSEILLDGALTLKMVTQICFLVDFFVSFSYVMIFVIVHSYVWAFMSTLFAIQTLASLVLLCDTALFDLAKPLVYKSKAILTATGLVSLTLFYLLQTHLISAKMRGTYFSVHFLVVKFIYDGFQSFFIWSRHVHDSGQAAELVLQKAEETPFPINKIKPL